MRVEIRVDVDEDSTFVAYESFISDFLEWLIDYDSED